MEKNISNDTFEEEVLNYKGTVIVDFYADWCGPCKMVAPILAEISEEKNIKICKVNVDDEYELSKKFGVMSIPTMILFKDGEQIEKVIGYKSKEDLIEMFAL